MSSVSNVNTQNIQLTPMRLVYNGVDLGGTEGGVDLTIKTKQADIKTDQTGDEPVSSVVMSTEMTVKCVLAETKLKDNWKVAFPFARMVTSGGQKMMYFENKTGTDLLQFAQNLILHPLKNDDADLNEDFKFFKAVPVSAAAMKFTHNKQVGLEVEFKIYMDTATSPARYLIYGDPSVGIIAATLVQASYTGTGNGTLGSRVAGSAAVTESITATCIKAVANGGIFEVIGGVSGPLGNAYVGVAFSSSKGSFTIADGATDFIVGDVFILTSTAANY